MGASGVHHATQAGSTGMRERHARFPVDLHTHTTASDGTDSPAELVAHAREVGLEVVGITDHDTIAGLGEALEAGRTHGIEVVPGVEISVADEPDNEFLGLHLLGYFIDPNNSELLTALHQAATARTEQKLAIVHNLQRLGFDVPADEVLKLAGDGVLGRMHIARVAWSRNPDRFTDQEQIFRDYISVGGLAYEPRRYQITLEEAVKLIRQAGGSPVLAHPGAYRGVRDADAMLRRAAALGIAGLEGPYTYDKNRPHFGISLTTLAYMIAHYLAKSLGLAVTGGSDYHGEHKAIALGERGLTLEEYDQLRGELKKV